ncbi:MAG TPA: M48 family metallopeptidase [Bryobacteraceae bacterium]|nr:M48 family metallopeptidase [Bryobacteraceae bacterium]
MLSLLVWGHSVCAAQSQPAANLPGPGLTRQAGSQTVGAYHANPAGSSPERAAQAIAYSQALYKLYFIRFAYTIAVLLSLLRLQVAPRLRNWAERVARDRFLQALLFVPALALIFDALLLPTNVAGQAVQRHFGLSIQSWGSWFWDMTKGDVLVAAGAAFVVWLVYAIIRRSPRHWWFFAWLAVLPVIVFSSFVSPLLIDPLFDHYTPLADSRPDLVKQIERVIEHSGQHIAENRIVLLDASRKSRGMNAVVTGMGSATRVVVWDTAAERLTPPQLLAIFGHELGHYVLGHIVQDLLFSMALLLLVFWAGFHVTRWVVGRFGDGWGLRGVADWASLPVLLLVMFLLNFASVPAQNAFERHLEHEADQYGLEVVHGIVPNPSETTAEALKILAEADLTEPSPSSFVKLWFYNHPAMDERIRFAYDYDPWTAGRSPRFVK